MSRRATIQLSRRLLSRSQRRYASDSHHGHSEPASESYGRGFYLTLAAVPLSFAVYKASRPVQEGEEPFITRWMKTYDHWYETWRERNELHTKMVEQAGYDRLILQNSPRSPMVDIKFNEVFNVCSPYNVPAGSRINLDKVIEHYNKVNAEVDVERERAKERARRREEAVQKSMESIGRRGV